MPAMEKKNQGDNWLTCVHLEVAVKTAEYVFSLCLLSSFLSLCEF